MTEQEIFKRTHNPKRCKFCPGHAGYIEVAAIEMHELYTYICEKCQVEYYYTGTNGYLTSWGIYTEIGDKLYKWSMSPGIGMGTIYYLPGIVPSKSGFRQYLPVVRELQYIKTFQVESMTITPSNVNEKLRTYLLFL